MTKLRHKISEGKSHYPEFQKASRTIADILINHQKDPRCTRCRKNLTKLQEGCAKNAIEGFKLGKGQTFSSLPFSFISGTFVDTPYSLLCYECTSFVKRSIGMIPELWSSDYFPQVSAPFDLSDLKDDFKLKKRSKWTIRFQGKSYPHTKHLKEEFLHNGVIKYKRDFPECPHSETKLKRLINSHKLYDKLYGKW